jgi:iron complex outermembrane receptor protein
MQLSGSGALRARIILTFVGGTAILLSPIAALAQDSSNTNATTLEKVIVTGSAIPRTAKETAAPVQTITRKDIERSGLTTVADVVRSISADNSGTLGNSFEGAFAGGASGVALRGLTVNSTLVLIDGRRAADYALDDDGERGFVDLNSIPLVAVERIEVLKDGGSALYGADAIAGVVNIILQKEFVGKDISAEVGGSQHGGGTHTRATAEFGTGHLNQNGYNAYFSLEYQRDDTIKASQRGFPYNTNDLSSIGGINGQADQPLQGTPIGSFNGTVEPGTIPTGLSASPLNAVPVAGGVPQLLNTVPGANPCYSGSTQAYIGGDSTGASGQYCQINPISYADIQPQVQRVGVHGKIEVKLNEDTSAYLKATFYDTKTLQAGNLGTGPSQINSTSGSPLTANIGLPPTLANGALNPNDPFASTGQWAMIQYQFADIPTSNRLENQNYRFVGGVKGTFQAFGSWNYDSALTINHTQLQVQAFGDLLTNQLLTDINNGSYHFLHSLGPTSQSVLNALAPEDSITNTTDLDMIDFRVNRELFMLPGGAAGLAMGTEYRYEAQNSPQLDPTLTNPDSSTYNEYLSTFDLHTAQVFGKHDVTAFYTELDAPVLNSLDIDGAFRYDHYTDAADHGITPKIGIKWTPLKQVVLRGTFSEGFRAPSFAESGSNSSTLGYTTNSAVATLGSACTGFVGAHCINGVPDAYVTNSYNQGVLTTGNPNILPEKSRNFTLGAVLQPVEAVSVSADYYHIRKTNLVNPYPSGSIFAAYFNNPTGYTPPPGVTLQTGAPDPQAPSAPALPIVVAAPYINANDETTQGYDIDLQMHFRPLQGVKFTSELTYTEIMSFRLDQPGQPSQQYAGTQGPYALSSGAGTPRDRASWANTVEYGPLTVTATINWVDGYKEISEDTGTTNCLYGADVPTGCKIAPFNEVDLVGNYKILKNLDATLNIQNLFDSKAPIDPADYAASNYNSTYTQKGVIRRFFIGGVHYRF